MSELAFPGFDYIAQDGRKNPTGMTLRDYFAAKALPELIGWGEPEEISVKAYKYADAMLKARKQ